MNTTSYASPVDKLLTYGEAEPVDSKDWPNYLELGFGPEHIPDLIRLATSTELRKDESDDTDNPEYWAPLHAWRTLGQLRAEAAIEPLLPLFHELPDDEWVAEELPEAYGMIGPVAIPAITAYIADKAHKGWPRINALGALNYIADWYPDAKEECIATFTRQLELFAENEEEFNSFLITALLHLKVREAAPLIKQAFDEDRVDQFVVDWDYAQVELGLKEREDPRERLEYLLGTPSQSTTHEEEVPSPSFPLPKTSHKHKAAEKKAKGIKKIKISKRV